MKSIDFSAVEVKTPKQQNATLNIQVAKQEKKLTEMESKVNENDRYSQRWSLRIYGKAEKSDENIKARVKNICRAIVPEEERNVVAGSLDVVHHLGRLTDGENNQPPRPVIMRFISRTARDMTWKSAKKNTFLKKNNLRFKEDLTAFDKEARNRLWPMIERTRRGKIIILGSYGFG